MDRNVQENAETDQSEIQIVEEYESFDDMELSISLLKGIYAYGFESPSAVQQKAIVPFRNGRNVIAQAQSGTGKTGTFSIGMLSRIDVDSKECQGLILAPTRELAYQILSVIDSIGYHMGVRCHICVGGTDRREDERILVKGGVHVVVGTPGRVYDMLNIKALDGRYVDMFVLDEADEMLDKEGFQDIVHDILYKLSKNVQIGLFSATMPQKLLELTTKFVTDPVKIIVQTELLTLDGISQYYVDLGDESYKLEALCDLYKDISIGTCVIFCNSQKRVEILAEDMKSRDFAVTSIHGSMSSKERNEIVKQFRQGVYKVLISTDLLARGIDVQQLSVVINYDLPKNFENYLHRIGRSGRFGRKGLAINFISKWDKENLKELEKFYDIKMEELPAKLKDLI